MKERKMRRYQNLLTISGLGVIIFALWSVLKTILLFFLREDVRAALPDDAASRTILLVVIIGILVIDISIRLFVGLSARAEGFGKKKGYAYIVFAVLAALASLASLVMIFFDSTYNSITELVVSVIVEATSLVVTIELLVAAFTVKKLKKELGEVS